MTCPPPRLPACLLSRPAQIEGDGRSPTGREAGEGEEGEEGLPPDELEEEEEQQDNDYYQNEAFEDDEEYGDDYNEDGEGGATY